MSLPHTCEALVPEPTDFVPIRSPQAAHSFIASLIAGKDFLEIGTRNGDGMRCFTIHAKRATAIEYNRAYCASLSKASSEIAASHPGKGFHVTCSDYRSSGVLDADVISWWEQSPLDNIEGLTHARKEQRAGRLRSTSQAVLLFDSKWHLDIEDWQALCPLASWSARIPFDERKACLKTRGTSRKRLDLCDRAVGSFIVAGIPIKGFDRYGSLTKEERVSCQARHRRGHRNVTDPSAWQVYTEVHEASSSSITRGATALSWTSWWTRKSGE
jgi:hypothetical protein